jgi:hypothetical protein
VQALIIANEASSDDTPTRRAHQLPKGCHDENSIKSRGKCALLLVGSISHYGLSHATCPVVAVLAETSTAARQDLKRGDHIGVPDQGAPS